MFKQRQITLHNCFFSLPLRVFSIFKVFFVATIIIYERYIFNFITNSKNTYREISCVNIFHSSKKRTFQRQDLVRLSYIFGL